MDFDKFLNDLISLKNQKYADFSTKLTPNAKPILGITIPKLREIAKTIEYSSLVDFIENFSEDYQECLLLKGMCICRLKGDIFGILKVFKDFIPKIKDWSVCDTTCMGFKIAKKHKKDVFSWIENLANEADEFSQRVVAVLCLAHFLDDNYIEKSLNLLEKLNCALYYTDMAVGWCVSTAFAKNRDYTFKFLENCNINERAYKFAIKKMRESLRISTKDKEFFKNKFKK